MKKSFKVILSTRQDGIVGLGAKNLVSNTKSRFFSRTKNLVRDQPVRRPDGNEDNLCAPVPYCFMQLCTTAISIIIIILSFHIPSCLGEDKMKGPLGLKSKNHLENYGKGDNSFLNIYQKWISPVKGGNTCPMYPACSQYAKIAFRTLPWYKAYTSSLERLLRCGNELSLYPVIRMNDQRYWYDPVIIENPNYDLNVDEVD
jgi:hypothetical protein